MLGETEKRHPREEHWYLEVLGTRPDRQGEGLGSALIRHGLERAEQDGLPAYLESSKESNVAVLRPPRVRGDRHHRDAPRRPDDVDDVARGA